MSAAARMSRRGISSVLAAAVIAVALAGIPGPAGAAPARVGGGVL
jgi:hypothetical protein